MQAGGKGHHEGGRETGDKKPEHESKAIRSQESQSHEDRSEGGSVQCGERDCQLVRKREFGLGEERLLGPTVPGRNPPVSDHSQISQGREAAAASAASLIAMPQA